MTAEQQVKRDASTFAHRPMTRRDLLRNVAAGATAGGAALAMGAATRAASPARQDQPAPAPEVDVTLLTNGYPFGVMPEAEAREINPTAAGYAEALQSWLDLNPGVSIEETSVNQWDQEALVTAAVGGTAPAWFNGAVLGGYDPAATFSAFQQGLAKDVTDLVARYEIEGKIADYVTPTWEGWKMDGRAFGTPESLIAGNGIFYRRDLIQAAGLPEPQVGWTWEDFRATAAALTEGNRAGAAMQPWGIGWSLNASGYDLLTTIPAPDEPWHWRKDFTSRSDQWVDVIQTYRDMVFSDGSVLSDITFGDQQCAEAFAQGAAGLYPSHSGFYTAEGTNPRSIIALAAREGKTVEEVAGWVPHPVGATGVPTNTQSFLAILSFSPDLEGDAIEKAFDLYHYMYFGPGYTMRRQVIYERSQDMRLVYGDVTPVNGMTQIEGIPGSAAEAWGTKYIDAVNSALAIPIMPNQSEYIPAEENPGPTDTAASDAQSRWAYEPGDLDVAADLRQLEETLNAQYAGFESSVPREEFVAGALAYYQAQTAYWQANSPTWFETVYQPWYDANVAPALG